MRAEGRDKRVTIATLTPRGAAVMDASLVDLAPGGTWRVQAEARAMAAEERACGALGEGDRVSYRTGLEW